MSLPPSQLDEIERIERAVLSLVVQALADYRGQISIIFREETDQPQDIAEDVTREAIAAMGVSATHDRLYGKVDVKKALYAFMPEPVPVALMLDAKAEKANGDRTATIQMSQTSMRVRMRKKGAATDEPGRLETHIDREQRKYLVVTIFAKYAYAETSAGRELKGIRVSCIPNGVLQDRYNPDADDGIWLAGRHSDKRGEPFRVRLSYDKLIRKAAWRVQDVNDCI